MRGLSTKLLGCLLPALVVLAFAAGCGTSSAKKQCVAPKDCTGDPGTGCTWNCNAKNLCEAYCPQGCTTEADCQGDPGTNCTWVCNAQHACDPICPQCTTGQDCLGDPGTGCTWDCVAQICTKNCTECTTALDCKSKGDPGAGCSWKCTADFKCLAFCPECTVPADCKGDPGTGCSWTCTIDQKCQKNCPFPCTTARDCQGDPGVGCTWTCGTDHFCAKSCSSGACAKVTHGNCAAACPIGTHWYGSPTCNGHACCTGSDLCCVPGLPPSCDDQTNPHQCVAANQTCPDGYPNTCFDCTCSSPSGGKCCVAKPPCTATTGCSADNECCQDSSVGYKQCSPCPGACGGKGGVCVVGPSCKGGLPLTDIDCGSACCADALKPLCCDYLKCNARTDCKTGTDLCCVHNGCILCQNVSCTQSRDCGPDADVCCLQNLCSATCN